MAGCSQSMAKCLLFVFNALVFLAGLAVAILGAVSLAKYADDDLVGGSKKAAIFVLCIGVFIFVVGFLGCCGAIKESRVMLLMFAVILGILVLLEFVAAIIVLVARSKVNDEVKEVLEKEAAKYNTDDDAKKLWDTVQHDFKCCGIDNSTTWNNTLPDSCCKEESKGCGADLNKHKYTEGCYTKVVDFAKKYALVLGAVALAVAFIELMGVFLACGLARCIKAADYSAMG